MINRVHANKKLGNLIDIDYNIESEDNQMIELYECDAANSNTGNRQRKSTSKVNPLIHQYSPEIRLIQYQRSSSFELRLFEETGLL